MEDSSKWKKQAGNNPDPGVSVVTCTIRPEYMEQLFNNYKMQQWSRKELIIVLNRDTLKSEEYRLKAMKLKHVRVFRMPESCTLGECLNFAVRQSKYGIIAKFDDDDYYSPYYLRDSVHALERSKADAAGKPTYYMYLSGKQTLILRFPLSQNRPVQRISGATLIFRKKVFERVRFRHLSESEVTVFINQCRAKGYKLASTGIHNFVAVRRKSIRDHTWKATEANLIRHNCKVIGKVKNYTGYVTKK